MQMQKDASYGIIPYVKNPVGQLEFLLIYQKEQFRGFPKGHKEAGESDLEAALRELREETGISHCKILEGEPYVTNYQFKDKRGQFIDKNAYFVLGEVPYEQKEQMHIDNHEVVDAFWGSYEQCKVKLTHQTNKDILEQAHAYLLQILL